MVQVYLKGIVRTGGKGRQGIGLELFRADADEDIDLTESESESIGELDESTAVMRVYESIGEDFFTGKGVTPKLFSEELKKLGNVKNLNIHINCLGGDAFAAHALHNIIRDHASKKKTAYIDGVCASAATIVACAADEVIARTNSTYMVHLPWAVCIGNSGDMRSAAEKLDTLTVPIVNVYKEQVKGRIREPKIRALMEAETWMSADEAFDYGFVDKVKGSIKAIARTDNGRLVANNQVMNVAKYHYLNVPEYPTVKIVETKRKEETQMVENLTMEELARHYPDLVASIQNSAKETERSRLNALEEMKPEDCSEEMEALIEAAKIDGRSPEEIAMECFNLSKQQLSQGAMVGALRRDGDIHVKAGYAPNVRVEDKKQTATNLLVKAFANQNGRKQDNG